MICKIHHYRKKEYKNKDQKSPTWSAEAHDRWGSYHCRALLALHEKIPPEVCGTLKFPNATEEHISDFKKRYSRSVRNENKKSKGFTKSALFGVFEISESDLVHMHFIARDFDYDHLLRFIEKFNKKNNTLFLCSYFKRIDNVDSISAYPFKFGFRRKTLFAPKSLKRYVYQTGQYFLGQKKTLEREGFSEFVYQKAMRNFDPNILCTAEDFLEEQAKAISEKPTQHSHPRPLCPDDYLDDHLALLMVAVICWIFLVRWIISKLEGIDVAAYTTKVMVNNGKNIEPVYPAPITYPP